MPLTEANPAALIIGAAAVLAALVAIWKAAKWTRETYGRGKVATVAIVHTIAGRDEVRDPARPHIVLAEALPSLGSRMDAVEATGAKTQEVLEHIATLIEGQQRQDVRLDDHGHRITALEEATVERVVTKAESAAAWRAVEAVARNTPDDPDTDL